MHHFWIYNNFSLGTQEVIWAVQYRFVSHFLLLWMDRPIRIRYSNKLEDKYLNKLEDNLTYYKVSEKHVIRTQSGSFFSRFDSGYKYQGPISQRNKIHRKTNFQYHQKLLFNYNPYKAK